MIKEKSLWLRGTKLTAAIVTIKKKDEEKEEEKESSTNTSDLKYD